MCLKPSKAWMPIKANQDGKQPLTFNPRDYQKNPGRYIQIEPPCGKCDECIITRTNEWGNRLSNQLQMTIGDSYFITLTYNDEHLPLHGSLDRTHAPKFIKALKRKLKSKLTYYQCGEYGTQTHRPHYHAGLFSLTITDLEPYKKTPDGNILYTSKIINKIWNKGNVIITELTPKSCAYIAKYLTKNRFDNLKQPKKKYNKNEFGKLIQKRISNKDRYYERVELTTGELVKIQVEESTKSPSIGKLWYQEFKADLYEGFQITTDKTKNPIAKYYLKNLKIDEPEIAEALKQERIKKINKRTQKEIAYKQKFITVTKKQAKQRH